MSFDKVESPHQIMKRILNKYRATESSDSLAEKIGVEFLKQGWYFSWCQQKWENENG